jgi:hypothetical protein
LCHGNLKDAGGSLPDFWHERDTTIPFMDKSVARRSSQMLVEAQFRPAEGDRWYQAKLPV